MDRILGSIRIGIRIALKLRSFRDLKYLQVGSLMTSFGAILRKLWLLQNWVFLKSKFHTNKVRLEFGHRGSSNGTKHETTNL